MVSCKGENTVGNSTASAKLQREQSNEAIHEGRRRGPISSAVAGAQLQPPEAPAPAALARVVHAWPASALEPSHASARPRHLAPAPPAWILRLAEPHARSRARARASPAHTCSLAVSRAEPEPQPPPEATPRTGSPTARALRPVAASSRLRAACHAGALGRAAWGPRRTAPVPVRCA
ncbi:uncharacterized protein LOC112903591 [Panicum hallii]|uniref:uncharacterized protein LOC112903591 n=1 Tax=Panicum hallii TaxID=206008 RepID=UPI000DF4ED20|nr:uncharacterized protein LOC112903591 [Panicum hallii]